MNINGNLVYSSEYLDMVGINICGNTRVLLQTLNYL